MRMDKTKIVEYAIALQELGIIDKFESYEDEAKCGFRFIKMTQEFKRLFKKYVHEDKTHAIAMSIALDNPELLLGAIFDEGGAIELHMRTLSLAMTHEMMQEITNDNCQNKCEICEFLSTIVLDRLEALFNELNKQTNKYSHKGDEVA